jgi:hypothetical protein
MIANSKTARVRFPDSLQREMNMRDGPAGPVPFRSDKELAAKASRSAEGSFPRDRVSDHLDSFERRQNEAPVSDFVREGSSTHRIEPVGLQEFTEALQVGRVSMRPASYSAATAGAPFGARRRDQFQPP